ncbi:MAG: metallophosphoesterase family protein [Cyclobacteriaceae bacterium]|nr:metallophosphoesterase family protein [Cyclobacteriaceae bacterium HetDA_MAG_MS6]
MKIGLISDTHGFLDPAVLKYFASCDEIWHAGDIGTSEVLQVLRGFKPVRAVFGNIDGLDIRQVTQEYLLIEIEKWKALMIHIAAKPPKYPAQVKELISQYRPQALICGHSHILRVMQDQQNDLLYLNPGAAGKHGFHKIRTLLRFEVNDGKASNMEAIELGPRSKL